MITLVTALLLVAVAGIVVLGPLLRARHDRSLAQGPKAPDGASRPTDLREGFREELRALEVALAEGKIDRASRDDERVRIAAEAERIAGVEQSGEAEPPGDPASRVARAYPVTAALGTGILAILTLATLWIAEQGDIRAEPAVAVATAEAESLDEAAVKAMIASLAAQVRAGDGTAEDVALLERSYEILGREAEILPLLREASDASPANAALAAALGMRLLNAGGAAEFAEARSALDRLRSYHPDLPSGFWLQSLIFMREGDFERAAEVLEQMLGKVEDNPEVEWAISSMLHDLRERIAGATEP